ncbi:MAG TPA: MMPL family transporter [Solirubrobacterales bacterium]|nr:MMPL family transporter [Solirubrobacterales bacterium]
MLAIAVVLAIAAAFVGKSAPDQLSYRSGDFYSHDSESFRAESDLEHTLPKGSSGIPTIAVLARGSPKTGGERIARRLKRNPLIAEVEDTILASRDGKTSYVLAWLKQKDREDQGFSAAKVADELAGPGVVVGGLALARQEFEQQIGVDLRRAQMIALPLLVLLGLWVFRSLVAALLPVSLASFALLVVLAILRGVGELFPLSVFSLDIALALALGLGVDYSLLMLARFREGLAAGKAPEQSAVEMLQTAGKTVAFSAAAIAASFSSLLIVPIPFVRSVAVGGGLAAIVTGLSALVLLPALLVLLGRRVNAGALRSWRRSLERSARPREEGAWYRIAQFATRRPVVVATVSGMLMLVLALPVLSMRSTGLDPSSLPASSEARHFSEKARREFKNPLIGEIAVAVYSNQVRATFIRERVNKLAENTGLATPFFVGLKHSPHLWQVRLNPEEPIFSEGSQRLVSELRELDAPIAVAGETAGYMDSLSVLKQRLPYVVAAVVLSSLLFVFLATGSLVLPIKTLAMNLLSLGAALGLIVLVFQNGYLEGILDYTSQDAMIVTLPGMVGVVAFGLLTDYGLFLLMRIKEERERGIPNRKAIALGLERSGRIITAAALLFAAAVGAFSTSGLLYLKVTAIAIVLTVLLDAFVVRPLLVPSLMAILGKWNWWPGTMPPEAQQSLDSERRR